MNISEKLIKIAQNEQKVYQAGYDTGYEVGYEEGTAVGDGSLATGLIERTIDKLIIPQGVTRIGDSGLYGGEWVQIVFNKEVASIGSHALAYNTKLTEIIFPDDCVLTTIGAYSFFNTWNLSTISLPDSVSTIGDGAFLDSAVGEIIFGQNISNFGMNMLGDVESHITLNFGRAAQIPWLPQPDSLGKITSDLGDYTIIVPNHLYSEWINRQDWQPYKDYIIPAGGKLEPDTTQFTMHVDADTLKTLLDNGAGTNVGAYELKTDEPCKYIRIYGDGRNGESFANAENIYNTATGKYMVYAYRLPTSNTIRPRAFQIYANTSGNTVNGQGDNFYVKAYTDDKWHVDVIDVAVAISSSTDVRNGKYNSQFTDSYGSFTAKKLRFDWFNEGNAVSASDYIDIAYIGFCDTIDKARSLDPDYTGTEFDAMYLWNTGAFNLKTTDTGMEYVSRTTSYNALGKNEAFVYLTEGEDYRITPNTTMYAGVLYRASTDKSYGEMYSCCANNDVANADWYTRLRFGYYYKLGDDWQFGVLKFNAGTNIDGATRLLRFDYLNGVENNGKDYTVDIGFVKFFNSVEEGEAYFEKYRQQYGI